MRDSHDEFGSLDTESMSSVTIIISKSPDLSIYVRLHSHITRTIISSIPVSFKLQASRKLNVYPVVKIKETLKIIFLISDLSAYKVVEWIFLEAIHSTYTLKLIF